MDKVLEKKAQDTVKTRSLSWCRTAETRLARSLTREEREDVLGHSALVACNAAQTFRQDNGAAYPTYLYKALNSRLGSYLEKEIPHTINHVELNEEDWTITCTHDAELGFQQKLEALSQDARLVATTLLGKNVNQLLGRKADAEPNSRLLSALRKRLHDGLGWNWNRVRRAFAEVGAMLAEDV